MNKGTIFITSFNSLIFLHRGKNTDVGIYACHNTNRRRTETVFILCDDGFRHHFTFGIKF